VPHVTLRPLQHRRRSNQQPTTQVQDRFCSRVDSTVCSRTTSSHTLVRRINSLAHITLSQCCTASLACNAEHEGPSSGLGQRAEHRQVRCRALAGTTKKIKVLRATFDEAMLTPMQYTGCRSPLHPHQHHVVSGLTGLAEVEGVAHHWVAEGWQPTRCIDACA
jgi:hypothetical protein